MGGALSFSKKFDSVRTAVTEPEGCRYAGTVYALKFFLPTFSFKKKYGQEKVRSRKSTVKKKYGQEKGT